MALALAKPMHCFGISSRDWTTPIEPQGQRVYVVVDNDSIHKAQAVEQWLADHPRLHVLWVPTYGPRANPIERVFGDVHDKCTRNHTRKRLPNLIKDVERYVQENGP